MRIAGEIVVKRRQKAADKETAENEWRERENREEKRRRKRKAMRGQSGGALMCGDAVAALLAVIQMDLVLK